ncbi:hypothetical protein INT45_000609 [Circinella minor]|uniref:Uncharacterized protein n=1 Tax=Circinella minor TaxID=1195481 RepID=A0A8H7SDS0_9FUNG|nr:hypothetical protein INT45_000609 [Circinella minor]
MSSVRVYIYHSTSRCSIILYNNETLDSGAVLIADFLARVLLPGAPILESPEFYIGLIDLQPFYYRYNLHDIPLHLSSTRAYRSTRHQSTITAAIEDSI